MLLAGLSTFAIFYCTQPLLPVFSREFGVSAGEASLAVSITIGPMAIALLFAGILSDRIGRRPLMIASLLAGGFLTLLCAAVQSWIALLVLRFLAGLALAGIPAVAMTYIGEEVEPPSVPRAMGLYISGTALGGMIGRILGSIVADQMGWRAALASIGISTIAIAFLFWRCAPPSKRFLPAQKSVQQYRDAITRLARDEAIPWLFLIAFLLMGAFIILYNYASFLLMEAPHYLSQSAVGWIFLFYLLGSFSSSASGWISGKFGPQPTLAAQLLVFLCGIGLTISSSLPILILGIGVATAGFFGAHSVASGWVGQRAADDRALASVGYMLSYYLGGSILGPIGGYAWALAKWQGVALCACILLVIANIVGYRLRTSGVSKRPGSSPADILR